MSRTRIRIETEDAYVQIIIDCCGVRTRTEDQDLAPSCLADRPMTREEALAMRGARAIEDPGIAPG